MAPVSSPLVICCGGGFITRLGFSVVGTRTPVGTPTPVGLQQLDGIQCEATTTTRRGYSPLTSYHPHWTALDNRSQAAWSQTTRWHVNRPRRPEMRRPCKTAESVGFGKAEPNTFHWVGLGQNHLGWVGMGWVGGAGNLIEQLRILLIAISHRCPGSPGA